MNEPGKNYVCNVALKTLIYLSRCVSQAVLRQLGKLSSFLVYCAPLNPVWGRERKLGKDF